MMPDSQKCFEKLFRDIFDTFWESKITYIVNIYLIFLMNEHKRNDICPKRRR